jgi:hypothetical protein
MSKQYDNTNRFYLGDNQNKRDEKDSDKSGYVNIEGVEYYLNGYNNRDGSVGGTVKPKKKKTDDQLDEGVPF